MTGTPKPTRETRRDAAVKPRKRRCVRIEVVRISTGDLVEVWTKQRSAWLLIGSNRYAPHASDVVRNIDRLRPPCRIRKVYEEAK